MECEFSLRFTSRKTILSDPFTRHEGPTVTNCVTWRRSMLLQTVSIAPPLYSSANAIT
jgi:hypothetical protein